MPLQTWIAQLPGILLEPFPRYLKVWHVKEPSLLNGHTCRAIVKICSPSLVMLTSPYEWKIFSSGTINLKKTTNIPEIHVVSWTPQNVCCTGPHLYLYETQWGPPFSCSVKAVIVFFFLAFSVGCCHQLPLL